MLIIIELHDILEYISYSVHPIKQGSLIASGDVMQTYCKVGLVYDWQVTVM